MEHPSKINESSPENTMKEIDMEKVTVTKSVAVVESSLEDEKKILWKIDCHILPLMFICYMLQYLDKTSLSYAAIMGVEEDTHLHGQEYSWSSSAFYFGYLVASYPVSLGFVRFPLAKFLSVSVCLWSIVLACHGATSSFAGLASARVFLGVCESVVSPSFSLITGMWYKPSEHVSRHAIWFAGNSMASLFGGMIAYGVSHINSNISSWRWLFIIFGIISLIWSVVLFLFLPDSPSSSRFLKPEEHGQWKKFQMIEALTDWKTWCLFIYTFLTCIPNGAITSFSSLIIKGFGYSTFHTLELGMPIAATQLILTLSAAFLASKIRRSRCLIMVGLNCISLMGCLLIRYLPVSNKVGRLFGIYILTAFAAGFPPSLSLIASNIAGFTKKTTTSAVFFLAYCAGNIVGPQLFKATEAPGYRTGFQALLGCFCAAIGVLVGFRVAMDFENRKRDREQGFKIDPEARDGTGFVVDASVAELDETDRENRGFRYVL